MNRKILLIGLLFLSCETYLRSIPSFPECKILKVQFPIEGEPKELYSWTVWTNTAVDSLEVVTYYQERVGVEFFALAQRSGVEHGVHPMSWVTSTWGAVQPGKYKLEFRVWNRWGEDFHVRWITIEHRYESKMQFRRRKP